MIETPAQIILTQCAKVLTVFMTDEQEFYIVLGFQFLLPITFLIMFDKFIQL